MRMTRQEFIRKRDKQRNTAAVCSLVALVIMFAPVGFMAWLEPRRDELPAHVWTILSVTAISLMVGGLALVCIISWRLSRRLGLCCPECKKPVMQMSSLVIATGRCGHCGGRVLDEAA
jgi:hypothetical protein